MTENNENKNLFDEIINNVLEGAAQKAREEWEEQSGVTGADLDWVKIVDVAVKYIGNSLR